MRIGLWSSISVMLLLFGFASGVAAKGQSKSWEVDLYDGEAEVTYVPDGRDDVHVYDHNNHYNDRSYIEVERPRYRPDYERHDRYDYGRHRYDNRHRGYGRQYRPRYRVEYHNRYRRW